MRQNNQVMLQWQWMVDMPNLNTYGFIIPAYVNGVRNFKNGQDFLLVLNSEAKRIIEKWKGKHHIYVFPSPRGKHYSRFNNHPFRRCRKRAGLDGIITWHSTRTTFATRLRAAGVDTEDRAQLLGHKKSITTQYSWADVQHLINCVEKLCDTSDTQNFQKMPLQSLFRL